MKRIALVTGVVGGIGAAIAARLTLEGIQVVTSDLEGNALQEAAEKLELPALAADLGNPDSVSEMYAQLLTDHGAPDILVNAAGGVDVLAGMSLSPLLLTGYPMESQTGSIQIQIHL